MNENANEYSKKNIKIYEDLCVLNREIESIDVVSFILNKMFSNILS